MKLPTLILITLLLGMNPVHADEAGTAAANVSLIRTQNELLNRGDWKATLDYYGADARNFGRPVGRAVMTRIFEDIYRMFPDYREEIIEITAVGDSVILRIKASGTHRGVGTLPVYGGLLVGVAPTNKRFEATAIHWYTLKGGKIADHHAIRDDLGMMEQLGLSPQPKPFDWSALATEVNR